MFDQTGERRRCVARRYQLLGLIKSKSIEELNSLSAQLVMLLFADGGQLGGPQLSFTNGVWVDRRLKLKLSFEEILDNSYNAVSNHVDFQTKAVEVTRQVNEINGLIKEVLPSGLVDTTKKLILYKRLLRLNDK